MVISVLLLSMLSLLYSLLLLIQLCHWIQPEIVCQIKFREWTRDQRLRQPVFLGIREDKDAKEVVREEPS